VCVVLGAFADGENVDSTFGEFDCGAQAGTPGPDDENGGRNAATTDGVVWHENGLSGHEDGEAPSATPTVKLARAAELLLEFRTTWV